MSEISEKREVVDLFLRGVDQSASILRKNPELAFSQIYNRIQWKAHQNKSLKNKLENQENHYKKPWLKLLIRPIESASYIRAFTGHSGVVKACAFSPDGKIIASGGGDNTIRLWETASGREIGSFKGHRALVKACAFDQAGKKILSASLDGTLKIWDVRTHHSGLEIKHSEPESINKRVLACAFSPDGSRILSGGEDHSVRVWEAESGISLLSLQGHSSPVSVCIYSPDGKLIVSSSYDKTIKIWDSNSGRLLSTLTGHTMAINDIAFSQDGKRLASASDDTFVNIWDIRSGKRLHTLKGHEGWVLSCDFSPIGKTLVSAGLDKTLRIWDLDSGLELAAIRGHALEVNDCSFSPDGRQILSASDDASLKLWESAPMSSPAGIQGHSSWILDCTFSPDGRKAASSGADTRIIIWDATGRETARLEGHVSAVKECHFNQDGNMIISKSSHNTLKLWKVAEAEEVDQYDPTLHQGSGEIGTSRDKYRIVSKDRRTLNLQHVQTEETLCTLLRHESDILCFDVSPYGRRLIVGDQSGRMLFYSFQNLDTALLARRKNVFAQRLKEWANQINYSNGKKASRSSWRNTRLYYTDVVIMSDFFHAGIWARLIHLLNKIDTNLRLYFEEDEVSLRESLGVLTHPVKTGDWILLVYENPAKIDDIIAPLMKDGYIMPVN